MFARLGLVHAASPVDERELVGVDVEVDERLTCRRVGGGCLEQLALRSHRHVLARTHRERAREQARDAGEEHDGGGDARRADAERPVRGSRRARRWRRRPPHGTCRRAVAGRVRRGRARPRRGCARRRPSPAWRRGRSRTASGPRRAGRGRARRSSRTGGPGRRGVAVRTSARGMPRVVAAEEREPVRLVAPLGRGEREQDLALLAVAARGELAVDRCLRPLVGQVSAPSRPVGRGPRPLVVHPLHIPLGSRGRSPGRSRSVTSLPPARPSATISARHAASARFAGIGSFSERRRGLECQDSCGAVTKSMSSSTRPSSAGSRSP